LVPADKVGLGGVFGQVQREGGTASMTGDEIDDYLEARAASVETGMGGDMGTASMNCLTDDFDGVFAVFTSVLRTPAFSEDKIELAKVQLNTGIARRNDNVSGIIGREFRRLIYGADSPLARLTEYATVASVTRDDLIAWHAKYYQPQNIAIGVVGDFDTKTMKGTIQTSLGDWAKGPKTDDAEVAYQTRVEPGVYFIEKEDVTQANIRVGHLGILRKNPDFFAVAVMNEVLGGGFSGRLMKNVRSDKGLAYSVFGSVGSAFLRPGIFQAGMSTKSSTMAESVEALKAEILGIINDPPSDVELQQAKESILNSFVFNYTSRAQILGRQMTLAYYGMPKDYLETYRTNIERVTGSDVARVAKKYIHPDRMALLVVGNSQDFDRPVATLGEVTEIDISIPPPADSRPAVEKNASSVAAGERIFRRVADALAHGAAEPVRSMTSGSTMTINIGGQSMSMSQQVSYVLPDKFRQVVKTPMGEQVIVFNGGEGFAMAAGRNVQVPQERVQEGMEYLALDLLVLVDHVGSAELETVAAGSDEMDGTACELLSVSFRGKESRLCVDQEGKVLFQRYQGKHPFQGNPGVMEVRFSEYKELDGRLIPHKREISFEGEELVTENLESIEINPDLSPALFELPDEN
jgi:predicted Zn-dependent peptidase